MSDLYRDFIDGKADEIINGLGGTITPAPANAELYRDFLDRKFDDVINACNGYNPVKSFTYTGNGNYSNNIITFPTPPKLILSINGIDSATDYAYSTEGTFAMDYYAIGVMQLRSNGRTSNLSFLEKLSDTQLKIRHGTPTAGFALNSNGDKYTVYYI